MRAKQADSTCKNGLFVIRSAICETRAPLEQGAVGATRGVAAGSQPIGQRFGWYGHHDSFYDIQHSRNKFGLFQGAGGRGTFLELDVPGGNGHFLLGAAALWEGPVAEYLSSLADGAKQR